VEVYILDTLYRRIEIVDVFDSLIWTERWQAYGEFQLDLPYSYQNSTRFYPGALLAINLSHRVMVVETIEKTWIDGQRRMKLTGTSLEKILDGRAFADDIDDGGTASLQGTPGDIMREVADFALRNSGDSSDALALLGVGTFLESGNMPEPTNTIKLEEEPQSAYSILTKLAQAYDLGFRLVREYDTSSLYFDVYTGSNRISTQQDLSPLIFQPNMGNLNDITELESIANYANVAHVYAEFGSVVVYDRYDDNDDPIEKTNIQRRVIVVNASPDPESTTYTQDLIDAGKRALAERRRVEMFDGEVDIHADLTYDVDYSLGDHSRS
jgi:hypothetical protein